MYVTVPTAPNVVVKLFFIPCSGNQRTYRTKDYSIILTTSIHDNKRSKDMWGHCNMRGGAEPPRQGHAVVETFSV